VSSPVRPLLLLDIDGVLNPFAAQTIPDGYVERHLFDGDPVLVNVRHGDWIRELAAVFDVVWVSGWGEDANRVLAPLLRLAALPVVPLPSAPFAATAKVSAVAAFAGQLPAVWIDDALTEAARVWAAGRRAATLLIPTNPAVGWTRRHVDQALRWTLTAIAR
jgi:hypothetical protein